ncbi:FecR domain-containing protein [Chitinophaga pendula]|uniref:FecR domain-containing protein n=1 Tax=Chitinophaga TaxID=79328 RepID=UPI000BAF2730|nr:MULTISPECIES: FecR domain-containing protein [Chitinophaga]ASZ11278.1 hypothetical protein CK934_10015 [Chitinophaga sp. MD30]UCJ05723.1 FecR domain-containing protein [Chitinophaga pendula]
MGKSVEKLFIKYLDGACTPEEKAMVEIWLQDEGNSAILDALLKERLAEDMLMDTKDTVSPERVAEWKEKLHQRIQPKEIPVRRLSYRFWLRAAILVAVVCGMGYYAFYMHGNMPAATQQMAWEETANQMGKRATVTLTDGTVVLLGPNSKLYYPQEFSGPNRLVRLTGEAFFDVSEDAAHPFVVNTNDIQTTVLGTSFRISAFTNMPVTVAVATGRVRVDRRQQNGLQELAVLTPGREVTWLQEQQQATVSTVNIQDVEGWKRGRLVFNNQPLKTIAETLERWYDVDIRFQHPHTAKTRITVTLFASGSIRQTLETLSVGSNFKYTVKDRQIIIH